jgi:hypothetical protein
MKKYLLLVMLLPFLMTGCENATKYVIKDAKAMDIYNKIVTFSSQEVGSLRGKMKGFSYSEDAGNCEIVIGSYVMLHYTMAQPINASDASPHNANQANAQLAPKPSMQNNVYSPNMKTKLTIKQFDNDVLVVCEGKDMDKYYPFEEIKKSLSSEYTITSECK